MLLKIYWNTTCNNVPVNSIWNILKCQAPGIVNSQFNCDYII